LDWDVKEHIKLQIFDEYGCIKSWDGYEAMLSYIFYKQLGWPVGDEGYVLATENTTTMTRNDRERLTQIMFETFNLKGMYLLDASVASLYAAGKLSGVSVDVGHTGTTIAQACFVQEALHA
jgi:actin-related protein